MKYSEKQIDSLRKSVEARISPKRFKHILGVENMAVKIGEFIIPDRTDELRVAALLHDISKEYSDEKQISIMEQNKIVISEETRASKALWHSITAPLVVQEEYPDFSDEDILSAVYNHTVGSMDMSVFDEIIMLSDYIEEGRAYQACIELRSEFLEDLASSKSSLDAEIALHNAVVKSLDNTINELASRGEICHSRTKITKEAIKNKAERLKMENSMDLLNCSSETLSREIVKVLIEKKGIDVKLFDVRDKSGITDFYVNVTGRSQSNVSSLADDVDSKLSERGRSPLRTEGKRGNGWILVDFGDVIVNVFDRASRDFYNLDRHLPEGSEIDISDLIAEVDAKFDINKN